MTTYVIDHPVRGSVATGPWGTVDYDYEPGDVVPVDDREEAVLAHMALAGTAKVIDDIALSPQEAWAARTAPVCPTCGHRLNVVPSAEATPVMPEPVTEVVPEVPAEVAPVESTPVAPPAGEIPQEP